MSVLTARVVQTAEKLNVVLSLLGALVLLIVHLSGTSTSQQPSQLTSTTSCLGCAPPTQTAAQTRDLAWQRDRKGNIGKN